MPTACAPTEPVRRPPPGSTGGASTPLEPCSPPFMGGPLNPPRRSGARLALALRSLTLARTHPPDLRRDHRRRRVAARRPPLDAPGRRRRDAGSRHRHAARGQRRHRRDRSGRDRRVQRRRRPDRRLSRPRHDVVPAGHPPRCGRHQATGRAVDGRSRARAGRRDAADRLRADHPGRGRRPPHRALQGQVGRHAGRGRAPLRRLDDDPVVGEQAQVQGRAPHRPGAADPAGQRARLHRRGR